MNCIHKNCIHKQVYSVLCSLQAQIYGFRRRQNVTLALNRVEDVELFQALSKQSDGCCGLFVGRYSFVVEVEQDPCRHTYTWLGRSGRAVMPRIVAYAEGGGSGYR